MSDPDIAKSEAVRKAGKSVESLSSRRAAANPDPGAPIEAAQFATSPHLVTENGGFDLDALRFDPQDHGAVAERVWTAGSIPIRKPNKQEFFRVKPGETFPMAMVDLRDEGEFYIVSRTMIPTLMQDMKSFMLRLCLNVQGGLFVWPVPTPAADGRQNNWHVQQRDCADRAEGTWIRMVADRAGGGYVVYSSDALPDPVWPMTLTDALKIVANSGRVIADANHPVVKRLRGEMT